MSAEQVGTLPEEAAKLIEAVAGWARDAAGSLDGHLATGSAECTVCPLCQAISALRSSRPELAQHLSDAAGSLLSALRALIDDHEGRWASRRSAPVEHIDVT